MPQPSRSRRPPFCPNPDCESHTEPDPWRFKKKGFHTRLRGARRVQRYLCQRCGRNFSSQTFSTSYWYRRTDLVTAVFFRITGGSCLRQIAREFGVAHSTIQRRVERLGRHCMLLHEELRPREAPQEPLVLDGFRTFEHSQFWPFDLNLLVGTSHFLYGVQDAELRRSGTMRPRQREKRAELEAAHGRPAPQATRDAVQELVERIVPEGASATLHSDEHQAYPVALGRVEDRQIEHHTLSSKESRTPRNPLFAVNLADMLMRHDGANHKRETIAFSKRRQGALYRTEIWKAWRNYVKPSSENKRDDPPAVVLGLIPARLEVTEMLKERRFPWMYELSGWLERCYFARIPTRALARCREHSLRYAV